MDIDMITKAVFSEAGLVGLILVIAVVVLWRDKTKNQTEMTKAIIANTLVLNKISTLIGALVRER